MNLWCVGEYTKGEFFLLGGMSKFLASGGRTLPIPPSRENLASFMQDFGIFIPPSEKIGRGSYELPNQDYISEETSQHENFHFLYNFNKNTTIL